MKHLLMITPKAILSANLKEAEKNVKALVSVEKVETDKRSGLKSTKIINLKATCDFPQNLLDKQVLVEVEITAINGSFQPDLYFKIISIVNQK